MTLLPSQDDSSYLRAQYQNASNLSIRIRTHQCYEETGVDFINWVLDLIDWRGLEQVLDAGCGSGAYAAPTIARCARYVATDLSLGMLRSLPSTLCARINLDVQHLPFKAGTFHVVLANHMLYHVSKRDQSVRQLRRMLPSGGILLAATNSQDSMRQFAQLMESAFSRLGLQLSAQIRKPMVTFTLESGPALLEAEFSQVHRHVLHGALVFPHPQPVIEYLSTMQARYLPLLTSVGLGWRNVEHQLHQLLKEHFSTSDTFRVNKKSGAFVCVA
jgi:ubiquinone/menaquinone biosynthesis C-methylase UbiE